MRRRVAEHVERVRIVLVTRGEDLDPLAVLKRQPQVLDASVGAYEHRFLGESLTNRARGVEPGRAVGQFERRVVG